MMRALSGRIALGIALAFFAGGATGFFVCAWHMHHEFALRHERGMGERMREHMKRQLDLTSEQLRVVDPILEQTAQRLQAIRDETSQRVSQTMEDTQRELATHLTPEQMARLQKMRRHHEMMLRHRGERRRPPPPPDQE